jgi:hypothetical protein
MVTHIGLRIGLRGASMACPDEMAKSVRRMGRHCWTHQEPWLGIRSFVGSQQVTNG